MLFELIKNIAYIVIIFCIVIVMLIVKCIGMVIVLCLLPFVFLHSCWTADLKVTDADVVGTWVAEKESLQKWVTETNTVCKITFNADKTFNASVPNSMLSFYDPDPGSITVGSGNWKILEKESFFSDDELLDIDFKEVNGTNRNSGTYLRFCELADAGILKEIFFKPYSNNFRLYYDIDDPDEGKRFIFERSK